MDEIEWKIGFANKGIKRKLKHFIANFLPVTERFHLGTLSIYPDNTEPEITLNVDVMMLHHKLTDIPLEDIIFRTIEEEVIHSLIPVKDTVNLHNIEEFKEINLTLNEEQERVLSKWLK